METGARSEEKQRKGQDISDLYSFIYSFMENPSVSLVSKCVRPVSRGGQMSSKVTLAVAKPAVAIA